MSPRPFKLIKPIKYQSNKTAKSSTEPGKSTTSTNPVKSAKSAATPRPTIKKRLHLPRFPKILPKVKPLRKTQLRLTEADLINAESSVGGTIFGPIPNGHRREFFLYKPNTWIFHESWKGADAKDKEITITYQVKKNGVFKSPLGMEYVQIKGSELDNFLAAAREYYKLLKSKLY